ncbi:MAG: hypothetical protein KF855_08725 [Acidobacteria bacterium]|nr:hypothetical protein [Acidobacteriota bacterium]
MNRQELRKKLDELGVDRAHYSLDGDRSVVGIVLYDSYGTWTIFDVDERGNSNGETTFTSEEEACHYIYKIFEEEVRTFGPTA